MRITPTPRWRSNFVELFVLESSDVTEAYVSWLNDPAVNRFLESRFFVHTIDSTRQFVESCLASPSTLLLGIMSIELSGVHVGNIKIAQIDRHHGLGEVGILVGEKKAWSRGIASAAIRSLINIARDELGLRKLTAGCYASNVGSQKAFLKAGFYKAGERKAHYLLDGEPEAIVLMDCLLK
jgi:[ribosomal protein S5]-alanine N-acetyltransferase